MNSAPTAVADLISTLSSGQCDLTTALLQARVLAYQIGQEQLSEWVGWELSGYPDDSEVPAYRTLKLQPRAVISSGYIRYRDFQLPTLHLEDDVRKRIMNARIGSGVAAIQEWIKTDSVVTYPQEFAFYFADAIDSDFAIESIWGKPGMGAYNQILVEIRSRLLGYVLELQKTFPHDSRSTDPESASMKNQRDALFKDVVFGHNTTIQLGNGNTATVTNNVTLGDVQSLLAHLRKSGVPEEALGELAVAIEDDGDEPAKRKKLGPAVAGWIGKAVAMAASGAWDIAVSASGTLVAGALSGYYGFSVT